MDDLFDIRGDDSVVLRVHVQPGAGRSAVLGRYGDALKVAVAAQPEGGRANDAVLALLARVLGVAGSALELVGGGTSRAKRVAVSGVDPELLRRRLAEVVAEAGTGGGNVGRAGRVARRRP